MIFEYSKFITVSTFYLNGACGIDIPVTNPDLVLWMLMMGQMGKPDSPDKETLAHGI